MNINQSTSWQDSILNVPDYPKQGISFKDITPLIADPIAFATVIDLLAEFCEQRAISPQQLVCPEARGFMFGSALAYRLGTGFLPVRKPGKLPRDTCSIDYDLEYGSNTLQMHKADLIKGQRVVLVDDVLATGGTMAACCELLVSHGVNVVACLFVMELDDLKGRNKIHEMVPDIVIHSLTHY